MPFAKYVRKGREGGRRRKVSLAKKIARIVCCCCGPPPIDEDDIDAVLARERGEEEEGVGGFCFTCKKKNEDEGQTAKSKDWGGGLDGKVRPLKENGLLGKVFYPCYAGCGTIAHYYVTLRENLLRLRNLYPLLAIAQVLVMVILSREDLDRCSFDARSVTEIDAEGKQLRVVVPENNWTLPLLMTRGLVGMVTIFSMWVCWERQRYYRQLVSSPRLMQVGMLLLNAANAVLFWHMLTVLEWHYVLAHDPYDCAYYTLHSAAIALLCCGVKRSWWDFMSLIIVPATPLIYLNTTFDLRWAVYILQTPMAAMLAIKLFRCFQDVRLLLVPAFLVLMHLGFSCLLLFVQSALMVVLRDLLGDVVGSLLLCLCIWIIPSTIEWVEDEELADLQAVGDAETAREALDKIREKHRVPKGYETLYEVNKARQDATRLKELMTGQNPDMYAELNRMYQDGDSKAGSRVGDSRAMGSTAPPLTMEQRRGDLAALRGTVLDNNSAEFNLKNFGDDQKRLHSQFSDAPGKAMSAKDPRRSSRDMSRPVSVASAGSVDIDVSGVSRLSRSPVTPRNSSGAGEAVAAVQDQSPHYNNHQHQQTTPPPQGRGTSMRHFSARSQNSMASGVSHASANGGGGGGPPAPPRAVPDGFAINLNMLPQEGRTIVLKEDIRQGANLALSMPPSPSGSQSWGPAEDVLRRNDSAMGGSPSRASTSSRATPNGMPKKSPGSGNQPPPAMPHVGSGVATPRFAGGADDDAMSVSCGMGRGRGRGRGASTSSTPLPPTGLLPPPGVPPGMLSPPASSLHPLPPAPVKPLPRALDKGPPPVPGGGGNSGGNRPPPPAGPPASVRPRSKPK